MAGKTTAHARRYERTGNDKITPIEYGGLQEAYEHFNRTLFGGELLNVFITYQRKANSMGYFAPDRFAFRVGKSGKHELALNPDAFINQTDEQICQTLVHEMNHVWQHVHGKPGARGYHNKEWAAKLKAIGLRPSSTGMVGGKETGQRMMDYIIPDGQFAKAFAKLAATGWKLNLQSAHRAGGKKAPNSKLKFTCPSCAQNAWGKPDLAITCTPCELNMLAELVAADPDADALPAPSYDPTASAPLYEGHPFPHEPTPIIDSESVELESTKRKRGRPPGSKNIKAAPSYDPTASFEHVIFRGYDIDKVGEDWVIRKNGAVVCVQSSKAAALVWVDQERHKQIAAEDDPPTETPPPKRKRGRPKGSKNKPKEIDASPSYDTKPSRKSKRNKHANIAAE